LDPTFGIDGFVNTPIGPRVDNPGAFLLQPNGQIVMGGTEDGNGEKSTNPTEIPAMFSIARYNSNGRDTFGTDGVSLLATPGSAPGPVALALLSNSHYLALGTFGAVTPLDFEANGDILSASISGNINRPSSNVVERFTPTGDQDSSFMTTGFEFGGERRSGPVALTVQSNGKSWWAVRSMRFRRSPGALPGSIPTVVSIPRLARLAR
jgi:hypothetical protein